MSVRRRRRHLVNAANFAVQPLERRTLLAVALDPTFGRGGVAGNALESDPQGFGTNIGLIETLSDGKILIGGTVFPGGEPAVRVARYTPGGLLDTTFDGDGLSPLVDMPGGGGGEINVRGAIQSDGKILIAAVTTTALKVLRFNADGSLDTAFGTNGVATVTGFGPNVTEMVSLPNIDVDDATGKIVLTGSEESGDSLVVARLNANGSPDTAFSGDGKLVIDDSQLVAGEPVELRSNAAVALAGGKSLVLVRTRASNAVDNELILVQLNADGSFDNAFSTDGLVTIQFGDGSSNSTQAGAIVMQSGGRIVVGANLGTSDDDDQDSLVVTRYNSDGTLDTTFGTNGIGRINTENFGGDVFDLDVDGAGRLIGLVGAAIGRWTADGDPDTTFAADAQTPVTRFATALTVDADDRFVLVTGNDLSRETSEPRPDLELGANGALVITGQTGTANNTITIAQSGSNVVVTRNGTPTSFPSADVRAVDVLTFDGNDTITVSIDVDWTNAVLGNGTNELTLAEGDTRITGGDGADDITVGDGEHDNAPLAGNDTLATGDGRAVVDAGFGNDSITTGTGSDSIQCGSGNDTASAGDGADTVWGDSGSDSLTGGAGDDFLVGGDRLDGTDLPAGDNVLHGGDGNDILIGAQNLDSLYGGANKDILVGHAGSDLLSGGGGKDKIAGNGGRDRIYGGSGDDQLDGGVHDDRVAAGAGNDKIFGGRGLDILRGEDGNDLFLTFDGLIDTLDGGAGDDTGVSDEVDILNDVINVALT